MTHIVYSKEEPQFNNEDRGFSAAVRIFQLTVNNQPEPEITMLLEAGKGVNDERMWYHVIKEDAYGYEPNGQYELLPEDVIKAKYDIDTNLDTDTSILDDIISGNVTSVVCSFAKSLRVLHVSEETFETIAPIIIKQPVDVEFLQTQTYLQVMTDNGLVIFKKIIK